MSLRAALHLVLHLAVPGIVAGALFRSRWRRAWLVMLATMVVDLDHLLARPVYAPDRCSIGFHPLHTPAAILAYAALSVPPSTRLVGVGLLIHMALDGADCALMRRNGAAAGPAPDRASRDRSRLALSALPGPAQLARMKRRSESSARSACGLGMAPLDT